MNEGFDAGGRPGAYLKPMLMTADGTHAGGTLVMLTADECGAVVAELEPILRGSRSPIVFTPPVYANDALGSTNPLFAVRALREFVALCLALNPQTRGRRTR